MLGRVDEGAEHLHRALALDPRSVYALQNLAATEAMRKRHSEALRLYRRLVEVDPRNPSAHHGVGTALYYLGRHGEALEALDRGVSLDPARQDIRGQPRRSAGDPAAGPKMSRRAARRKPRRRGHRAAAPAPAAPAGAAIPGVANRQALAALGLGLLAAAVYLPAFSAGFVWDDEVFTDAAAVREWSGLWKIWFAFSPRAIPNEGHYWPLVHTTFWIEHKLWGFAPAGYHAVNVLLHAANTVLLWRLAGRLEVPGAWAIAAVFAVHPCTSNPSPG